VADAPSGNRLRRIMAKARGLPGSVGRVIRAAVDDPTEVALYVVERISERRPHAVGYVIDDAWDEHLHGLLGAPWPCPEDAAFEKLWSEIAQGLAASSLELGRFSYGQFSDADPSLARAAWCTVRHLMPLVVVETGVAKGITSRVVLEALERNGRGHLWSIDLPHLFEPSIHVQTGAAVPPALRHRWTYVHGSSRRRLPGLLRELGAVEIFVHDSLHTVRNMRFEMDYAWRALGPGGVMIVDDVYNQAFREFVEDTSASSSMVCRSGDGMLGATCPSDLCWAFGIASKTSN